MAGIAAALVVKLRKMSGQGMMDCKKALEEANGNLDEAMAILRKKGLSTLAKREERETSEGAIVGKSTDGGRVAVLASLCCETDFVTRSDDFTAAVENLANYALACKADEGTENLLETAVGGRKFRDVVTEVAGKTGEKIAVGDYARFRLDGPGLISTYIHFNKKVGTMVEIGTSDDKTAGSEEVKRIAADIAMHITATKPIALDQSGVSAETIAKEREIAAAQVKNKPANIIDKIVDGKIKKFFAENCLLEQQFVKDNTKMVSQVLAESAQKAGGTAKIKRFVRFEVG
jgi:elongation factor Ts